MQESDTTLTRTRSEPGEAFIPLDRIALKAEDFRESFGEELLETLNVENWRTDRDLGEEYRRIESEVRIAVERETEAHEHIRELCYPKLNMDLDEVKAGPYEVSVDEIKTIHDGLLFPGGVEACDGTSQVHKSLALTIHQIGVSLVSYRGDQGTWSQRLFRRDLRQELGDPAEYVLELLKRRNRREGLHDSSQDVLSQLAQRAVMSYAERAILLKKSNARWRMGHGSPAPLELLTGGGSVDLVIESIKLIRELIEQHQRFIYIASEPNEMALFTLGQALRPLEFIIVGTLKDRIALPLEKWHYEGKPTVDTRWDGEPFSPQKWITHFRDQVAPKVVVGLYRATLLAPPQLFYAHIDHFEIAARIAIADSALQEERGFPLLIDMADQVCKSIYGGGTLKDMANSAYAATGAGFRYQSERANRES